MRGAPGRGFLLVLGWTSWAWAFVMPSSLVSRPEPRLSATAMVAVDVDLSGDGSVRKVASRGGDGAQGFGEDGDVAVLSFVAKTKSGQVLDKGVEAQYTVGDQSYIPGWDLCCRSMRVGEVAAFECGPSYAYGPGGVPPAVKAGEALTFEIEAIEYRGNVRTSSSFASDKSATGSPGRASGFRRLFDSPGGEQTSSAIEGEGLPGRTLLGELEER